MKNKHIIGLFLSMILLNVVGALLKILHFEIGAINGSLLLTIGMIVQGVCIFVFLIKILNNKENSFLNK